MNNEIIKQVFGPDAKEIDLKEIKKHQQKVRFTLSQGEQVTLQCAVTAPFNGHLINYLLFVAADGVTNVAISASAIVWKEQPRYNQNYSVLQVVRGRIYVLA